MTVSSPGSDSVARTFDVRPKTWPAVTSPVKSSMTELVVSPANDHFMASPSIVVPSSSSTVAANCAFSPETTSAGPVTEIDFTERPVGLESVRFTP